MRIIHLEYEPKKYENILTALITVKRLFRKPVIVRVVKHGHLPWEFDNKSDYRLYGVSLLNKIKSAEKRAAEKRIKNFLER